MLGNTKNETNIKLPFSFILFSLPCLIGSMALILFQGDSIINSQFRVPAIWSAAHLFILGWALMTAMGAMYQLVPVAFLTPIWNERFGFIQFAVTAFGILFFAHSLFHNPESALVPGLITLTGILMFLLQMFMTLRKQAKPNVLTLFVGTALFSLLTAILLGIIMVFSMKTGFISDYYQAVFKSHILLGTAGWFTLLIFGFSYKMVPMFSLSHGYSMKPAKYVFTFYAAGLSAAVISFFTEKNSLLTIALMFLAGGFAFFTWHMLQILKRRVKKKLDYSFRFALLAIPAGLAIHLGAFLCSLTGSFESTIGYLAFAYLLLWVALSIMGYLFKIIPFLWWTWKYSKEIGKRNVPSLKEMMNDKASIPVLSAFILGILSMTVSIANEHMVMFLSGQILTVGASLVFCYLIISVIKK
ncbi:hypothetical protein DFO70_11279 [Cytobacillus firmus]|uniref:Uncharacterized protein n=2 Tax=Cytobacillus TaxID=2675230 RepID=A0A366JNP1_CYTFI|nr:MULTISPECIES: hypothetical protein [Cytobacillus]RBP89045.1 hypothetical protein DFO70_11279 [Cytobacillus firmus]TDX47102.1 hypothetical protein DFO72_101187 [Cytobacillus oceanisediminis]